MLEWVFAYQRKPTNLTEAIVLSVEKKHDKVTEYLLLHAAIVAPVIVTATTRPLVIMDTKINMGLAGCAAKRNSVLLCDVALDSAKALKDLEAGIVSLDEINYQNDLNWTALMLVCIQVPNIKLARKLLDLGAKVNLVEKVGGYSALQIACRFARDGKIATMLLNHSETDVNIQTHARDTPLHWALYTSNSTSSTEIVEMLLKHPKIDVNVRNKLGNTPLIDAIEGKASKKVMEMLLQMSNIDINVQNEKGDTALMLLLNREMNSGDKEIAKLLLNDNRTGVQVPNHLHQTPIMKMIGKISPRKALIVLLEIL